MGNLARPDIHVDSIDLLRGYASLMVCAYHLSAGGKIFEPGILREFFNHGGTGVAIFFVITGFVIPFSLSNGQYSIRNFGTFLLKRLIRLEPPYLASMLIAVLFWLAFKFHAGTPLNVNLENILFHFGYMVGYAASFGLQVDWYAPVYWSLQYELQFYLLVALLFPLVNSRKSIHRISFYAVFLGLQLIHRCLGDIDSLQLVYRFADLFLLGILIFQKKTGLSGNLEFGLLFAVVVVSIGLENITFLFYGPLICILVLRVNVKTAVTGFLGKISYSLYLYHEVVGLWLSGALVTVAKLNPLLVFPISTCASILFAYVMYLLIERPAMRMAKAFSYR